PPRSTLFPYTTLFRSVVRSPHRCRNRCREETASSCRETSRGHSRGTACRRAAKPSGGAAGIVSDASFARLLRRGLPPKAPPEAADRKSTRLNSSHVAI